MPEDNRVTYERPRAMRVRDARSGSGDCMAPGSGDQEYCDNPGNSAAGDGCDYTGNDASGDCVSSGFTPTGECIASGAGASPSP